MTDTLMFAQDIDEQTLRKYAASVDANSEHSIAKAIADSSEQKLPVKNFKSIPGKGAEGRGKGKDIKVVSPGYLQEQAISMTDMRVEPLQRPSKPWIFAA